MATKEISSSNGKKPATKSSRNPAAKKATNNHPPATAPPDVLSNDQIGRTAGEVWHQLAENDGLSLAAIKKSLDAPSELVLAALGWLAREGKLVLPPVAGREGLAARAGRRPAALGGLVRGRRSSIDRSEPVARALPREQGLLLHQQDELRLFNPRILVAAQHDLFEFAALAVIAENLVRLAAGRRTDRRRVPMRSRTAAGACRPCV